MTVKELIEALQKYDNDSDIVTCLDKNHDTLFYPGYVEKYVDGYAVII